MYNKKEKNRIEKKEEEYLYEFQNSQEEHQGLPARNPNVMDVDRIRERDRTCYNCGKFEHMARNCQQKRNQEGQKVNKIDMSYEPAKDNGSQ